MTYLLYIITDKPDDRKTIRILGYTHDAHVAYDIMCQFNWCENEYSRCTFDGFNSDTDCYDFIAKLNTKYGKITSDMDAMFIGNEIEKRYIVGYDPDDDNYSRLYCYKIPLEAVIRCNDRYIDCNSLEAVNGKAYKGTFIVSKQEHERVITTLSQLKVIHDIPVMAANQDEALGKAKDILANLLVDKDYSIVLRPNRYVYLNNAANVSDNLEMMVYDSRFGLMKSDRDPKHDYPDPIVIYKDCCRIGIGPCTGGTARRMINKDLDTLRMVFPTLEYLKDLKLKEY